MLINEIFEDIEGEGRFCGYPTLFIRVARCNLRCRWCDTKYAYFKGKEVNVKDIIKIIKKSPFYFVNITGGEPLLYKTEIKKIIKEINNKFITIETNGSISIRGIYPDNISMDLKLPSSNEHKKMNLDNLKYLRKKDQIKLVVGDNNDLIYAKKIISDYKPKADIIVQPVYKKFSLYKIKQFILKNKLNWKLSIQLHKMIKR